MLHTHPQFPLNIPWTGSKGMAVHVNVVGKRVWEAQRRIRCGWEHLVLSFFFPLCVPSSAFMRRAIGLEPQFSSLNVSLWRFQPKGACASRFPFPSFLSSQPILWITSCGWELREKNKGNAHKIECPTACGWHLTCCVDRQKPQSCGHRIFTLFYFLYLILWPLLLEE